MSRTTTLQTTQNTALQGELSPDSILQLAFGFWASKALLTAVSLDLFSTLSQAPLDADSVTSRLGLHPRGTRDWLDALVALRLLERQDGLYRNSPDSELFLDRAKPTYIGGMIEMMDRRLYGYWGRLTEALKTGHPQNEVLNSRDPDLDLFAALYADPDRLRHFLGAMTGISRMTARAIAAAFDWSEVGSFVDVGCAQGGCTVEIARTHPHLTGIGFDLQEVEPVFTDYIRACGLTDRIRFEGGSFFAQPIPAAEVIVMGHILHDWDLAQKRVLLAKAYAALPTGGRLIVYDAMIDDQRREHAFGLLMSLNMLIETNGGFDYTGADCLGWMREAGFRDGRVTPLTATHSMAVAIK
ncbi:methyltransferase [Dongia soli]|uniref:Methyltransferase n=1 Tax=Dongia soli TaxID=600628 RepID=A0ABU5E8P2_9PROT|nr:methyltransferase [Dongia soli]MDY0882129.1 methyltransferase [Dongia soli]